MGMIQEKRKSQQYREASWYGQRRQDLGHTGEVDIATAGPLPKERRQNMRVRLRLVLDSRVVGGKVRWFSFDYSVK